MLIEQAALSFEIWTGHNPPRETLYNAVSNLQSQVSNLKSPILQFSLSPHFPLEPLMPLRFLTAGESHGPSLTAILDGMPAGLPITASIIDLELTRRQQGYGSGGRMKIERDTAQILGGVMAGETTGAPIAMLVENADHIKWKGKAIEPMTSPRPGHADLTGAVKFGYKDLRPALERASARETTMRVAVGAV